MDIHFFRRIVQRVHLTYTKRIFLLILWTVTEYDYGTQGHTINICYLKYTNMQSGICKTTHNIPVFCNGKDISVTTLSMYVVRRCNQTSQCLANQENEICCSIEHNEEQTHLGTLQNISSCTNEQCLNLSLDSLPNTSEFYQVLRIIYTCNEDTNENADENGGFAIAGYVIIPLLIVLVSVVIGIVWYRKQQYGKQSKDQSNIRSARSGQGHATPINNTYGVSSVTITTEVESKNSEENGFDDYSEISTVERNIPTNLDTEYNVLNLKNRSVQSDPNYGILSARPVDPDAFYFQVQKQDNGTQGDPYNHIGQTYKGEGGNDSTYNSAQFGAQGEHGEEDTYNHIEPTQAEPESQTRCSVEYSKIQAKF